MARCENLDELKKKKKRAAKVQQLKVSVSPGFDLLLGSTTHVALNYRGPRVTPLYWFFKRIFRFLLLKAVVKRAVVENVALPIVFRHPYVRGPDHRPLLIFKQQFDRIKNSINIYQLCGLNTFDIVVYKFRHPVDETHSPFEFFGQGRIVNRRLCGGAVFAQCCCTTLTLPTKTILS